MITIFYLVIVVLAVEKRLLQENHAGQHAAEAPHVQTVVVHLRREGLAETSGVNGDRGDR